MEAEARRERRAHATYVKQQERAAIKRQRELQERIKRDQANRDAAEAEAFANYLDVLVSVHKDCGPRWDWHKLEATPRPAAPSRSDRREAAARSIPAPTRSSQNESLARVALDSYQPGFFDKLIGRDVTTRTQLAQAVELGRAQDEAAYQAAVAAHAARVAQGIAAGRDADEQEFQHAHAEYTKSLKTWEWLVGVAAAIRARHPEAYRTALQHLVGFDELEELGNTLSLVDAHQDVIAIDCVVQEKEVVPQEEVSLSAKGKLSTKAMNEGKRNALYQDHVCSCALRIAREVFALLPIDRVVVNVGGAAIDTSTGHTTLRTLLAVHFTRAKLESLNFDAIDPSDSMRNFDHRMAYKKSTGFGVVEPITVHDQWASGS